MCMVIGLVWSGAHGCRYASTADVHLCGRACVCVHRFTPHPPLTPRPTQAEDSRILGDMALMRKMYTELFTLNNELIGEYTKRSNNHQVCTGMRGVGAVGLRYKLSVCMSLAVASTFAWLCTCLRQNLLNALKDVNHMIQKAARLRVGKSVMRWHNTLVVIVDTIITIDLC